MRTGLITLLFPPKCPGCGELLEFRGLGVEMSFLCNSCQKRWDSELLDTCGNCGMAVKDCNCMTELLVRAKCESLRKRVYYFHGSNSAVQNRLLFKIKNQPSAGALGFLAEELEETLRSMLEAASVSLTDAVLVYLPRSRRSAAVGGTDQGKQLAYALSRRVGIPVVSAIRRRRGREKQQKHLNLLQRQKNARAAYAAKTGVSLKGKAVILVDDIVTTGSTMAAGVRLLRGLGAERVFALSVAVDDNQKNANLYQPTFRV